MTHPNELSEDAIAAFEAENPDIQIDFVDFSEFSYELAVSTGDIPDVMRVSTSEIPGLVAQGFLLDLGDYFGASGIINVEDIASAANYFRVEDAYYGLPKDWSPDFTIWVSNIAFEEAGIPIPDPDTPLTYAELGDIARELTIREGDTVVTPGLIIPNYLNMFTQILIQHETSMFNEDYSELQLTDNLVAMEIAHLFYDMSLEGIVNLDWQSIRDKPWNGELTMIQWGYWYGGAIAEDNLLYGELTLLSAPTWDHDLPRVDPTSGPVGLAISATSEHPDEAYRLFEWYIAGTEGRSRASQGWGAPPLLSMLDLLPQETAFDQQRLGVLEDELQYSDWQLPIYPYLTTGRAFNEAWMQHIQRAVAGEIDFETFASDLQETVNLAILNEQLGQ
jgi:multiple sugar transport system substrate-binding protein